MEAPCGWGVRSEPLGRVPIQFRLSLTRLSLMQPDPLSSSLDSAPPDHSPYLLPLKTEPREAEGPEAALSSEEEHAGLETVKSLTFFRELGPGQPWEPAGGQDGQSPGAGARAHSGTDLRLEVKSPSEPGYVVTDRE